MKRLMAAATLAGGLLASNGAAAQGFLGEVRQFQGQCPSGWVKAQGQTMQIMESMNNQAIFSLVGTEYGGDGRKTFALPRLDGAQPGTAWCFCVNGKYPSRN
jgi:hypothetical protein